MANEKLNKALESGVESIFRYFVIIIKTIFVGIYRGIRKLNSLFKWGIFLPTILISAAAWSLQDKILSIQAPIYIRYLLYGAGLGFPLLCLFTLGIVQDKSQTEYDRMFKDVDFIGRDKKYPIYCGSKKDGKKIIYTFKSNIPLPDWGTSKAKLETGLNVNILKLENGNNKKIVRMTTLPADFEIPKMIEWSDEYCSIQNGMITVGQSALESISFDLNRTPHVLVAGETGSGKSVILRCILWQAILQACRVYMMDFKGGVEFGKQYEQYGEVVIDRERALEILNMLVQENEYRLRIFRDLEVKNLREYNKKTHQNLCRICVFSDEVAQMLDKKGVSKENRKIYEEIEGKLSTLARLSRATGINLFLGVQRPDANVLTGQIKNNIPVRISGRFADKTASEIVLGNTDAVDLPDIKGRFLYKVGNETIEFQSYYFDDKTMLHDVNEEVGSMLLEAPSYTPRHYEPSSMTDTCQKQKEQLGIKQKENKAASYKEDSKPPKLSLKERKVEKKIEENLEKMDEYDLNLDFWNEKDK